MQGLIIGWDAEFTRSLTATVESIGVHNCFWHRNLTATANIAFPQFDFVVCHYADDSEFELVLSLLTQIGESGSSLPVVIIGQDISLENKIRLLKAGVFECLDRPINHQRLRYLVESIQIKSRLIQQRELLSEPHQIPSREFKKKLQIIADVDANVLITGETGVGKTHVAKQIHQMSKRRRHPFVAVNCGAIPENLIESELFGHTKGTFTGADRNRTGKLDFAGSGTILLDEIDAMPLAAQAKLLHVVDEHVFQPLGSNQNRTVKARIIAATNKSLESLVEQGAFRSDLFYRLDVFELELPSLRDRRDEILLFARIFAKELAQNYNRKTPRFSPAVSQWMRQFDWPGNLREIKNCVEQALLCCQNDTIEIENLPLRIRPHSQKQVSNQPIRGQQNGHSQDSDSTQKMKSDASNEMKSDARNESRMEKNRREIERVIRVLEDNDFNRTRAAEKLGISRTAFYKKLHSLGLL